MDVLEQIENAIYALGVAGDFFDRTRLELWRGSGTCHSLQG